MWRGGKLLLLVVAVAVLALPACRTRERAAQTEIDLRSILPLSLEAVQVLRLDPAAGPQPQWLVLYKYDVTERFSPIAGVVYRSDRGGKNQPPAIFPYPLRLPDRDYLGSENVSVRIADVLSTQLGAELVAENRNADGFLTEVAIFRWRDPFPTEVWRAHDLEERHYECMGFFRADGEVIVEMDRAVVKKLVGDRSQLARFYEYQPNDRGSYLPDGVSLKAASRSWIDFAFGQTSNVLDSPYPEKIVLAFYNSLGSPTDNLKPFLSKEGQKLFPSLPGYGCDWSPGQVAQAMVHQITYFPGVESQVKEEEAKQALVELRVQCRSVGGVTMPADAHVGWFLKREDGRWKMDQIYRPTG
jgi:hypothetical protein